MGKIIPNREYIIRLVNENSWSASELSRKMQISRSEANRFLKGERIGGKKLMAGIIKAFPEEALDKLFIF